ncbi:MAG: response regulator transcription factor [Brachymonas sp.]|nr:response regulator transcription factor [Brachymonas sp.]
MRVLLIEDDPMIGAAAQAALKDASCAADWVKTGPAGLDALAAQHYDLVLLDLGLPGKDGLQVLRAIRGKSDAVPVLITTARDGVEDRIAGLDAGADDYVIKPFDMNELLARMRAVLRRKSGMGTPVLDNGLLRLDPATHEVWRLDGAVDEAAAASEPKKTASSKAAKEVKQAQAKSAADVSKASPAPEEQVGQAAGQAGQAVRLSKREFALLYALMLRPGAILSRAQLEDRVYGWGEEVESNAIEFLIHALRRKLGSDAIKNVRGAGWMVPKNPVA